MISFISLTVLVLPREGEHKSLRAGLESWRCLAHFTRKKRKQHQNNRPDVTAINFLRPKKYMKAQTGRIGADVAGFRTIKYEDVIIFWLARKRARSRQLTVV